MTKANVSQLGAFFGMLFSIFTSKKYLARIEEIDGGKLQDAMDFEDKSVLMNEFIKFINNDCQIVKQVGSRVMQFLTFVCEVSIPKVKEFVVGDFYKHQTDKGIRLYLGSNFVNWIVNPMKEMKISLSEESKLKKHLLKKNAYDTEIHTDFSEKPIIPVKKFVVLLQAMISAQPNGKAKEGGLDTSGKANIFNIDLSELGDNRVVAVHVRRAGGAWYVNAHELDYYDRWDEGYSFFAPATA